MCFHRQAAVRDPAFFGFLLPSRRPAGKGYGAGIPDPRNLGLAVACVSSPLLPLVSAYHKATLECPEVKPWVGVSIPPQWAGGAGLHGAGAVPAAAPLPV